MRRHGTSHLCAVCCLLNAQPCFPIPVLIDISPPCYKAVLVPGSHMLIFTYIFTLLGNSQSASIHTDKLGADIYCEKSWLFSPPEYHLMFWQKLNSVWRRQSTWFNVWWGGGEHPYLFSYSRQDNEVLKYFHSCPQRRDKIASIKTKQSAWAKCGTKYVFKACCRFLMLFYFSRIYSASLTEIKMQEKSKVPACFSVWL